MTNKIWGWGSTPANGLNSGLFYATPTQIGTLDWTYIDGKGQVQAAIRSDGTLWVWGSDYQGSLGQGTNNVSKSSPVQIAGTWSKVSAGRAMVAAIKSNGTLWVWGFNLSGELGQGDTTHRSSPTQVGAQTDWAEVTCGNFGVWAVKTTGKLYVWGGNSFGQLGLNDTVSRSSPVQVGTLTNWKRTKSAALGNNTALFLKTDGTLWGVGQNSHSEIGDGTAITRSSPVQTGSATDWIDMAIGQSNGAGIRGTGGQGTLWQWGGQDYGEGPVGNSSIPIQLGAAADWTFCHKVGQQSWGIRAPGKLFSWGRNASGVSGDPAAGSNSPIQVGTGTDWLIVTGGDNSGASIYGVGGMRVASAAAPNPKILTMTGAG
jgi:alpha-tubulin suppressor-like RCC1 family protein